MKKQAILSRTKNTKNAHLTAWAKSLESKTKSGVLKKDKNGNAIFRHVSDQIADFEIKLLGPYEELRIDNRFILSLDFKGGLWTIKSI